MLKNKRALLITAMLTSMLFSIVTPALGAPSGDGFGSLMGIEMLVWAIASVALGIGLALFVIQIIAMIVPGIRKFFGGLL